MPTRTLELGKTPFDQFQQKRGRHGDAAHTEFAEPGQQGRHPFLPGAGPFAVAETGAVQEIVEGNAMMVEQANVALQIFFRKRCRQIARTTAADTVVGKLAVDFINRVGGERRNKIRIVVRRH